MRRDRKILHPLPRRSGVTETDFARARRALPTLGSGWALDCYEDCDRSVSLVISAADEREDIPAFALHAEAGGIVAGMVVRDHYFGIGRYERIEEAMRAVGAVLRGECPLAA